MFTTLPLEIISIEDDGYHIFTNARINDMDCRLLIDTGASRSVFDKDRMHRFSAVMAKEAKLHAKLSTGLGTNAMKSYVTTLKSFQLGKLKLGDYEAIMIDMTHVNNSYRQLEMPEIDGVIGGDILHQYQAVIDYSNARLILSFRDSDLS